MARAKRFVHNQNNNAVCYYRYSSDSQRDVSIDQQKQAAENFCKARGYRIIKEYADSAMSGTRFDRPQLHMMLNDIKRLRPGYLILWKGDRLSRDRIDAAIVKRDLREYGVKVEYVAESLPEDEAERVLMEGMMEAMAEHFIIQHSKNVTRGLNYNAEKAWYNGRKILGYIGQKNQCYEVDPETAPIVQQIFEDYVNGKPMKVIADELNAVGYRTVRGMEFTEKSLWHTLHNRSYIGEYKWGDIVVSDGFPPLISVEMFERAQEMMQKNKHGGRGGAKKLESSSTLEGVEFWLTGHLYCGKCGAPLSGTAGTSHTGKVYSYYTCNNHRRHKCDSGNIKKEYLERVVAAIIEECINNASLRLVIAEQVYKYYQREYAGDDNYEKSLVASIKDVEAKLNNIMKAIEAGIFNETTQARMEELQKRKSMHEDELATERNRKKYALKQEHVVQYLECFVGSLSEPSLRDKVLDYLVEKIYTYEDKIVINFYYSDDKREVDLKDYNEHLDNINTIMSMISDGKAHMAKYQRRLAAVVDSVMDDNKDCGGTGENF